MTDKREKEMVDRARERWNRILNMDSGVSQSTAAALWAVLYAEKLVKLASQEK